MQNFDLSWEGLQAQPQEFFTGLGVGMIAAVVLWLLLRGLVWLALRRRRSRGIRIPGEHGDLLISVEALRDFVGRVLQEFPDVVLRQVKLHERRGGLYLALRVHLVPGSAAPALHDRIKRRVREDLAAKVGVEDCSVDVDLKRWNAKPTKLSRAERKAGMLPAAHPDAAADEPGQEDAWNQ